MITMYTLTHECYNLENYLVTIALNIALHLCETITPSCTRVTQNSSFFSTQHVYTNMSEY